MGHKIFPKKMCLFHLVAFVMFMAVSPNLAQADEASDYQRVLEQWSQKLPDLEKTDTGETAKDIALIRSWIGQAQAFIASEDFEKIDPIIARVETMAEYVSIRQNRVKIEAALKKAEEELAILKKSIAKTKGEADALRSQVKQTEKKK